MKINNCENIKFSAVNTATTYTPTIKLSKNPSHFLQIVNKHRTY